MMVLVMRQIAGQLRPSALWRRDVDITRHKDKDEAILPSNSEPYAVDDRRAGEEEETE